jgi:hypothetical protein
LAYLASLGRLVPASARSNRQPRLWSHFLVSISSPDCCERGRCVLAIFGVRVVPAHDEPRSGSNNSERGPTSGRSTNYGSGHLIRVFRDIGRIFSLLFLLQPSVARWSAAERKGFTEYGFVEGKNGFNCVSCGTHRGGRACGMSFAKTRTPPEGDKGGVSGTLSSLDVAVTTERVRLDKRAAAGSGSSTTPAASVTSRSGSHFCI